jgi:hypothetical protein
MDRLRVVLEGLHRWHQAAVWSPILILPMAFWGLATGRIDLALTVAIGGVVFNGLVRARLAFARCPACGVRFGHSAERYRRLWRDLACDRCDRSLFDLRRAGGGRA